MTWFKLDDKSAFHRKVLAAGNEAWGAFCRAGASSSGEGTDGLITRAVAEAIAPARVWARLVAVGLAERDSEDYRLHDFLDWNPSAEQVRAKQAARQQAGKRGGLRSGETRSKPEANGKQLLRESFAFASDKNEPPSRPVPVDPPVVPHGDPKPPRSSRRKPSTGIPDDVPSWLSKLGIPPESDPEVAKFLDHHRAKASVFADWLAAWRNWERRSVVFAARDGFNGRGQAELPTEPQRHIPMPKPLGADS